MILKHGEVHLHLIEFLVLNFLKVLYVVTPDVGHI